MISRPSGRTWIWVTVSAVVVLVATAGLAVTRSGSRPVTKAAAPVASSVPSGPSALETAIAKAQTRLATVPEDRDTWAALGLDYVQQARITTDPAYYPKAEGALDTSFAIGDQSTNWEAMTGYGALANARHEFAVALAWGKRAEKVNPYNATIFGVEDDALTQLGRYPEADAAVQRMLNLEPGVSSFARASYHFEEQGRVDDARYALQQALTQASDPADVAFCHQYLGELAFNSGDLKTAAAQFDQGMAADPSYDPLLADRARAEAAAGDSAAALTDYATVTARVPQPQYLLDYAELLQSRGRTTDAQQQLSLLSTENQLFAANGVVDDLTAAVVDADHGSATDAVTHARAEWARRKSVLVADALGWALHRAGQDTEALTYAKQANRLGWKNATFRYHLGAIELALGQRAAARSDLSMALQINPYFSLIQAPVARKLLASLGSE